MKWKNECIYFNMWNLIQQRLGHEKKQNKVDRCQAGRQGTAQDGGGWAWQGRRIPALEYGNPKSERIRNKHKADTKGLGQFRLGYAAEKQGTAGHTAQVTTQNTQYVQSTTQYTKNREKKRYG